MAIRIICITKDGGNHENPYTAIQYLGWIDESNQNRGKSPRLEIYDFIEKGGRAYVIGSSGIKVAVQTATTHRGTKYVRTVADGRETNNLLSLPAC